MTEVKAKFIIELMGRPKEHLTEALNQLIDNLSKDKGVKLSDKICHDPKPVENAENLFITFADLDLSFENLQAFFGVLMGYMPSHVEVYEPEKLKLDAPTINDVGNFIVSRLHRYDAMAKRINAEKEVLINQLEHLRKGGKFEDFLPKETSKKKTKKEKKKSKNK